MSAQGSDNGKFGVVPIKGEGWMHFRFHGGPQLKVNRVFMLGTGTFVELQKGAEELLGNQSNAIFYEAGIRSGREAWETLNFEFKERGDDLVRRMFSFTEEDGFGWFKVENIQFDSEGNRGIVEVTNSFIANTYGKAKKPVCHFIAGFIAGFVSATYGADMMCDEAACMAVSGEKCVFKWEQSNIDV